MSQKLPTEMQAAALNKFGGPDELKMQSVAVPEVVPDEVLIELETAGVGEWDTFEREGGYAEMLDMKPTFPYVIGSEGVGVVIKVGDKVQNVKEGDIVYAQGFLNPKGGFYAEHAVIKAELVSHIPGKLTHAQAAVVGGVAITALRGLDDTLKLKRGETLLILGGGGGIGHVAIQLAKRLGAKVLAVASGADGVALAERVGADAVVEGHDEGLTAAIQKFAPNGLDAVLLTAGGEAAEQVLQQVRKGGRAAYPNGIEPVPEKRAGIELSNFNGDADADIIKRVNELIQAGPFEVHIAQTFPLAQAAEAHRALEKHYLGKLALQIK